MCRVLDVVQSGDYTWRQRQPSARRHVDEHFHQDIHQICLEGRGVYGHPRVHPVLLQRDMRCGRKRVARLMRYAGLSVNHKPRRACTTDSQQTQPGAANVLPRNFRAQQPNEKWEPISPDS